MPSVENKFSVIGFGFLKNGGFFFQMWCKLELSGKREPRMKNYLHQISMQMCLCGNFLINDGYARPQHTMSQCQPHTGGPGLYKMETGWAAEEQARIPPWPLLWFLPPGSCFSVSPGFPQWWTELCKYRGKYVHTNLLWKGKCSNIKWTKMHTIYILGSSSNFEI